MKSDDETQERSSEIEELVGDAFDDMSFSQEQSALMYEWMANFCTDRARLIRREMGE